MGDIVADMTPVVDPLRLPNGQFPAGVSGNPNGRPLGRKNEITDVAQELELALRRHVKSADVVAIIDQLVLAAKGGSIQAARLILDKVLPNASSGSGDDDNSLKSLVIRIENATYAAQDTPKVRVFENETVGNDTSRQTT